MIYKDAKNYTNKFYDNEFFHNNFRHDGIFNFLYNKFNCEVSDAYAYSLNYNKTISDEFDVIKSNVKSYPIHEFYDGDGKVGTFVHYYNDEYLLTTRCSARKSYNIVIDYDTNICKKFVSDINLCVTTEEDEDENKSESFGITLYKESYMINYFKDKKNFLIYDSNNKKIYKYSDIKDFDFFCDTYFVGCTYVKNGGFEQIGLKDGFSLIPVFCDSERGADEMMELFTKMYLLSN